MNRNVCSLRIAFFLIVPPAATECSEPCPLAPQNTYLPHRLEVRLSDRSLALLRLTPRSYVEAHLRNDQSDLLRMGIHLKGNYGTFQDLDHKGSFTLHFPKSTARNSFRGMEKIHLNN